MNTQAAPIDRNLAALQSARLALHENRLRDAAETLNAARKKFPRDPRVWLLAALLAEKSGRTDEAVRALETANQMAPDWAPGLLELALLHARLDQSAKSIALARKVHALEPANPIVLGGVVDIARRARDYSLSVQWLNEALALTPSNPQLLDMLAHDYQVLGRFEDSLAALNQLATVTENGSRALLGRARLLIEMGRGDDALADLRVLQQREPDQPTYAYLQALARGETPPQLPPGMVEQVFNGMAAVFDEHLVRGLGYQLPRMVADRILAEHPDRRINVLDLGCGTGLLGACLGRLAGALVGVDLSEKMVDQAARHGVYNKFHLVSVQDALTSTPDGLYDVLAALDVLIYIGDLESVFPHALRLLKPGGTFYFSIETAAADAAANYQLLPAQRYAHRADYVMRLVEAAGFVVESQPVTLRKERGEPIAGLLVRAQRPAVHH